MIKKVWLKMWSWASKFRLYAYLWWRVNKAKIKPFMKPTLAISFMLAWFLTNGWAYLLAALGTGWVRAVALTYISILWLPFTPEKLITIPLAFFIQKLLFIRKEKIYDYKHFKKEVAYDESQYKAKKC